MSPSRTRKSTDTPSPRAEPDNPASLTETATDGKSPPQTKTAPDQPQPLNPSSRDQTTDDRDAPTDKPNPGPAEQIHTPPHAPNMWREANGATKTAEPSKPSPHYPNQFGNIFFSDLTITAKIPQPSPHRPLSSPCHRVVPNPRLGMRPAKLRLANLPLLVIPEFSFRPRLTPALPTCNGGMKISGIPPDSGNGLRRQPNAPPNPVVPKRRLAIPPADPRLETPNPPPQIYFPNSKKTTKLRYNPP